MKLDEQEKRIYIVPELTEINPDIILPAKGEVAASGDDQDEKKDPRTEPIE